MTRPPKLNLEGLPRAVRLVELDHADVTYTTDSEIFLLVELAAKGRTYALLPDDVCRADATDRAVCPRCTRMLPLPQTFDTTYGVVCVCGVDLAIRHDRVFTKTRYGTFEQYNIIRVFWKP